MQTCFKCQGTNFIKEGRSKAFNTVTYVLCSCGNVMIRDTRYPNRILPTPETNSEITKFMIVDAGNALGMTSAIVSLEGKDYYGELTSYIDNLEERETEDCSCEDCDCEDCDYFCEDCGECEDDCTCFDIQEDEISERFINITEKIIIATGNQELIKIWRKAKEEGALTDLSNNFDGLNFSDALKNYDEMIEIIPDAVAALSGLSKEDLVARAIGESIGMELKDLTGEELRKKFRIKETEFNNSSAPKHNPSKNITVDTTKKEETKSYIILEKDGGWQLVNNVTKAELSDAINDCGFDAFMVKEILPVSIKSETRFCVE